MYKLVDTGEQIELQNIENIRDKSLYVDFLHGPLAHRRKYGGGRKQLIARAIGIKKDKSLRVLDATAGLGRDAFVLACLGCKVDMLERSPTIAALLEDGIKRAQAEPEFNELAMNLIVTDAISYLQNCKKQYDVIYLDPMFPERTKSALVKKEMRILRAVVGEDVDAIELLQAALKFGAARVVVKRSKLAPVLAGPEPSLIFSGKSSRFDVYLPII